MIVREIQTNPVEVMKTFDWFNDYDDTLPFVRRNYPEIEAEFITRYTVWLEHWRNQHRPIDTLLEANDTKFKREYMCTFDAEAENNNQ